MCNIFSVKNVSYKDLLKDLLPKEVVERLPRSFDIIGDIAVIRLSDDLLIYSEYISKALMSVHKNIRSVFAKKSVSGLYRVSELIHIGGEYKTETVYKENDIKFVVDIKRMFINTRMSTERNRIANMINDGEKILDLFAGYGAFSLNIAKNRDVYIIASDINDVAIEYMRRSIYMNKLKGSIDCLISEASHLAKSLKENFFDVIIMDNPTMIYSFIDLVPRLLREDGRAYIYVLDEDTKRIYEKTSELNMRVKYCVTVREYSPSKNIFRCELHKK